MARTLRACLETGFSSTLAVRLDDDDPALPAYRALDWPGFATVWTGQRVKMGGAMVEAFARWPDAGCYGPMSDDAVPMTARWDAELTETAGDWFIAFPDDLLKGAAQATHPHVGGAFLRAVGFWSLPGLVHLYTDAVWDWLGRLYGNLIYRPDVVIDHRHFSTGRAPMDATYERTFNGKPHTETDRACFTRWTQGYSRDPGIAAQIAASVAERSRSLPISEAPP